MSLIRDFFDVLLDTEEFFRQKRKTGMGYSFLYFGFVSFIALLINLVLLHYNITPAGLLPFEKVLDNIPSLTIYIPMIYFISGFFFAAFFAALVTGFLGAMGTKTKYNNVLKVVAFGLTPSIISLWVPVLGILLTLWSLHLIALGLGIYNSASLKKNLKACIAGGVVAAVFVLLFLVEIGLFLILLSGEDIGLLWGVVLPGIT